MKLFSVLSSNPSNEGKSFVTKLQHETVVEHPIFGAKTKKETYYISGSKQVTDKTVKLDIDKDFRVAEYPFELTEGENAGEVVMLKWLHLK